MTEQGNEQHFAIKFCFKLSYSATNTYKKLQEAYTEKFLSRAQIFRRFKEFQKVEHPLKMSLDQEDLQHQEMMKMSNALRNLLRSNRRIIVRLISESLDLNHTTVHQVLINELGMRKFSVKFVPPYLILQ